MASLKVAVRVRPFNQRERDMGAKLIIQMDGKKTRILNTKPVGMRESESNRDRCKEFTFDHSYWSFDDSDSHYISQEEVYSDLGTDVIESAFEGYNACVFAYGQTGSGKTFTMMGSADNQGLIPRICKTLFARMQSGSAAGTTYRTEVSYLEIYNERVKDLLRANASHSLKVREHPKRGPYVEDLSRHLVSDFTDIQELMIRGNTHRTTASTNMNDVSSRSHAIFTIMFVQAGFSNDMPSETVSKVHLVDLAGSERADATGATGQRLKEGAHINKSLVTLGSVISALAELSSARGDKRTSSGFVPYRDSVLTWLLKDSLGGNSKTIMIAAISPADCNHGETLSTLRYANRAKNIVNRPTVNEDPNVRLIRELRDEISKLKALIMRKDVQDVSATVEPGVLARLQRKQAQEKVLTEEWAEKWRETQLILREQRALGLRKSGLGVVLDSDMPHLVGIDDDLLSTGVTLYHLKEGETRIGTEHAPVPQDIVLTGAGVEAEHCHVVLKRGVATLVPASTRAQCWVNTALIDGPTRLSQGCIVLLGRTNMFRYNDPAEAARLREGGGARARLGSSRLSLLSASVGDLATDRSITLADGDSNTVDSDARRELNEAWKRLERERRALDDEYRAQCRRLADDWRRLEERQIENEMMLRRRESELQRKRDALEWERSEAIAKVENECSQVSELESSIQMKQEGFRDLLTRMLTKLNIKCNASDIERLLTDSQDTLSSEDDSSFLLKLLQDADQESIDAIRDLIEQHKRELSDLELELQAKIEDLTLSRDNVDKIDTELFKIPTIGPGGDADVHRAELAKRTQEQMQELIERKQSLTLNLKQAAAPMTTSTETPNSCEIEVFTSTSDSGKVSPTSDYSSPLKTCETFHTATSACSVGGINIHNSNSLDNIDKIKPNDTSQITKHSIENIVESMNNNSLKNMNTNSLSISLNNNSSLKVLKMVSAQSDSDISSGEDRRTIEDGHDSAQSSSSFERVSPYDISRLRKRTPAGREAVIRAMKRLCQRMSRQKMAIVRSVESETCSRNELDDQISALQDLQRQYVELEIALQNHVVISDNEKTSYISGVNESDSSDSLIKKVNSTDKKLIDNSPASRTSLDTFTEYRGNSSLSSDRDPLMSEDEPAVLQCESTNVAVSPMEGRYYNSVYLTSQNAQDTSPYTLSLTRSLPTFADYENDGYPVSVPTYVLRGAGTKTHFEYEVRISVRGEHWSVLRRYRRFRDLHLNMRSRYGSKVDVIPFPPRQLFASASENVAKQRRVQLEAYLRRLLTVCTGLPLCPLYVPHSDAGTPISELITKAQLLEFSVFFRRGTFECGKRGTS